MINPEHAPSSTIWYCPFCHEQIFFALSIFDWASIAEDVEEACASHLIEKHPIRVRLDAKFRRALKQHKLTAKPREPWTPEQIRNAQIYGVCPQCRAPRRSKAWHGDDGLRTFGITCDCEETP